ncbi:MAG: hypothetical protein Q7S74_02940 [Nanoarchaeota archaeon]|nr:hypothetical protein [Nanoarchaeota archaeon]
MKKRVVSLVFIICALSLIITAGFVIAVDDEVAKVNKAYACLGSRINESTTLSFDEAVFSALALDSSPKPLAVITAQKNAAAYCWPTNGCSVKETAQAGLIYNRLGNDTRNITNWLLTQVGSTSELKWYLQIVTQDNAASQCTLFYDGGEHSVSVKQDMKLEGNPGTCFTLSSSGYWLQINNNCLGKELSVSCDKEFKTNLLYEKGTGGTIYVSATTHSASAGSRTTEKVTAKCFKKGSECDYEGSLWAALLLYKTGNDTSEFVPYLLALESDNDKYLPSAFLNLIMGGGDQYKTLLESEKQGRKKGMYWDATGSPYGKFYDSALGLLSLGGSQQSEAANTVDYLFQVQTEKGCWNSDNLRDTAFLLYAGWPKPPQQNAILVNNESSGGSGGSGGSVGPIGGEENESGNGSSSGGYNPDVSSDCEVEGYYCSERFACLEAEGNILPSDQYPCINFRDECCTVKVVQKVDSCDSLGGKICKTDEQCSTGTASSSDGQCCLGDCEAIDTSGDNTSGNTGGETPSNGSSSKLWIIILIILIILVALAIIFRNKIRIWWFKFRGKAKTGSVNRTGGPPSGPSPTGMPPRVLMPRGTQRYALPRQAPMRAPMRAPVRSIRPMSQKDKEMEETLQKLKKMSE